MPRRTNPFQKLNAWLQDSLAGLDAVVTESAMIFDHRVKKDTEVDVLMEFKKGGIPYRTAIECRNEGRKADISWIRELRTKREDCKLDKIAAVHSKGFSSGAVELAGEHNIPLYLLRDIPTDQADASLALKYFGAPLVSHSILRVGVGIAGLGEEEPLPKHQRSLYLADRKTTVPVHELACALLRDHPPPHDGLQEGQYSDIDGTLPVNAGEYFVKCGDRFLEVRQLFVAVRVFKSAPLTGPTAKQRISVSEGAVAEIAAARIPGPGGMWTWGVVVDVDSQKPQAFLQLPPDMNPLDIKGELDVSYREKDGDEIKDAKIPCKPMLVDEAGSPIPLVELRVEIKGIHHDGPEGLGSEHILGFYFADKQHRIDLKRFIAEEVRRIGLPEEHLEKGEKKRTSARIRVAPDEARPLLMKIRQQDEEQFIKVNAVNVDLEWWLQVP